MATEKLNPNAWDNGWPTGYIANVDEPVANADGQAVSTTAWFDTVIFDLDASAINDIDVVTDVGITVRAKYFDKFGGDGTLDVSLLVGGVSQGTETTSTLNSLFGNHVLSNAGWDSDWTAAQLAGMQVKVVADSTFADDPTWSIDCIDVDITYTENDPVTRNPDEAALALAGKIPLALTVERKPAAATPVLLGIAPSLKTSAAMSAAGSLALAGQLSYVNPTTVQLQPDAWDSGWPTGYAANIDEPVSDADGQVVSTTINGDVAFLDLDDVPGTVTNEDTVLNVTMLVRAKFDTPGGGNEALDAELIVNLVVDGTPLSSQSIDFLGREGSWIEETLSQSSWDDDWTVAQLNAMQVKVTALGITTNDFFILNIDALDVYVKHSAQSPLSVAPPVVDLALSGAAPTVQELKYEQPLVGTLVLAGQQPALKRFDVHLPSPDLLMLAGKAPARIVNHLATPGIDALVLAGQVPPRIVNDYYAPAVRATALAGKVPVPAVTVDHLAVPSAQQLVLSLEAPLIPQTGDDLLGPAKVRRRLVGKLPVTVDTSNLVVRPGAGALALARHAAVITSRNKAFTVTAGAVTLASAAPAAYPGTSIPVLSGSLAITGQAPQTLLAYTQLELLGYAPAAVMTHLALPAAAALALAGQGVEVENASIFMYAGQLQFAGQAPSLEFSSLFSGSKPRLISLTVDRSIEFIATPTDILIE